MENSFKFSIGQMTDEGKVVAQFVYDGENRYVTVDEDEYLDVYDEDYLQEEEIDEMTLEDICEELGRTIKIIK